MLSVIAARKTGGVFSPSLVSENRGETQIIYIKDKRALKKLKKRGLKRALIAPSAMSAAERARVFIPDNEEVLRRLPDILGSMAPLPVGELYLSMESQRAAEIIGVCSDCARLFTVVNKSVGGEEAFDKLYFNKGIVMRRVGAVSGRIGSTALCISDGGRPPAGVAYVDLSCLGRVRFYGGCLDFLEKEHGIAPTAELYAFAGIPLPDKGKISVNYGDKIFYLDMEEKI